MSTSRRGGRSAAAGSGGIWCPCLFGVVVALLSLLLPTSAPLHIQHRAPSVSHPPRPSQRGKGLTSTRSAFATAPAAKAFSGAFHPSRRETGRNDICNVQELELRQSGKLSGVWLQVRSLQHSALSTQHSKLETPRVFYSVSSANGLRRIHTTTRCSATVPRIHNRD